MKPRTLILIVSLGLVLAGGVWFYGFATPPTAATGAEALRAQVLPGDLPALAPAGDPAIDAGPIYERAVALCVEHEGVRVRTREHDELVDQLGDLLLEAAAAGRVEPGLLDGHVPIGYGAPPDYGIALENINPWVLERAAKLHRDGETDAARELTLAVWRFGRRLFEQSVQLYHRNTGLDMMESAGSLLFEMASSGQGDEVEALHAWSVALNDLRRAWQPKLELVLGTAPHPGDLVNVAVNDADRTFRLEATLRLGIHRYGVGRGDRRVMNAAIRRAAAGDDPLLAEAGRVADALTRQQKRRLY